MNLLQEGRKGFYEPMKLLLSCISTRHSTFKQHWNKTREEIACPLTVLGSYQKPEEDPGGQLVLLEEEPEKSAELKMAAGMAASERGVFVTTFASIHEVDDDLTHIQHDVVTSPLFNALHSLSRTQHGYLVASTGLDLLVEYNRKGDILWQWWATDHGFEHTPTGQLRVLDKEADHRTIKYGTLAQTTHVNSAAELPDGRILASLFHQGMVIVIERKTGNWQLVIEGLDHPHAIRVLDPEHFTVADTVHGRALLVHLHGTVGHVEEEINAETSWLQDGQYSPEYDRWVLVDGKNSRVLLRGGRSGTKSATQIELDPEWRLYEALVL